MTHPQLDPKAKELFRRLGQVVLHGDVERADFAIRQLDRGWYFPDEHLDTYARQAVNAPADTWVKLRKRLAKQLFTYKNHEQRYGPQAPIERDPGEALEL